MISLNVDKIKDYISRIPFVKNIYYLEQRDFLICGKIEIAFDELAEPLDFEVEIYPQYPLKSYDSEAIKFINKTLIEYDHVMENGSICIHTLHSINVEKKLLSDFESLKNWIVKYYINKAGDPNYEHIIVSESAINDVYYAYIFTEVDYEFEKHEFGKVKVSNLNAGSYKEKSLFNFIVQKFINQNNQEIKCQWSEIYQNHKIVDNGLYIFIENAPAKLNRFAFESWSDFGNLFQQNFLWWLHNFEKRYVEKYRGRTVPLFVGYKTVESEIHWQVALLELGKFPLQGVPEKTNGRKTGRWDSELTDAKITWALSRNSSYKYFFGRGTLSGSIINKKILILGIGAIGSIVATTLVRGGCKYIDLADHDVKEPENVCRSEYIFETGINGKVEELIRILSSISPFVEVASFKKDCFETLIKVLYKEKGAKAAFESVLNQFDIIFDCTTDNDLMYILNSLNLTGDLINMSITNHAKDLVCAFYPNIYQFVNNQFGNILENDVDDLYNPTGCWSPTFKASYNDINVLVQMALKHINILYQLEKPKNNFIIKTDDAKLLDIKIEEY